MKEYWPKEAAPRDLAMITFMRTTAAMSITLEVKSSAEFRGTFFRLSLFIVRCIFHATGDCGRAWGGIGIKSIFPSKFP